MSVGWVRIHRRLLEHPIWTARRFTRGQAWVELILRANFQDSIAYQGNQILPVKRGQVLTTQVTLAHRWKWNRKTVRTFLEFLKAAKMVDIHTSRDTDTGYTLITLLNYDHFQGGDHPSLPIDAGNATATTPAFGEASNGHRVPTIKQGNNEDNVKRLAGAEPAPAAGRANGKGRPARTQKVHPETRTFLDEFCQCFEAKFRTPYLPTVSRDHRLFSELLTAAGPNEVRSRMGAFFENGTKRTRNLGDYGVPAFRSAWNELGVLRARGDL
jgi:hypothetical protein